MMLRKFLLAALVLAAGVGPATALAEKGGRHERDSGPGDHGRPDHVDTRPNAGPGRVDARPDRDFDRGPDHRPARVETRPENRPHAGPHGGSHFREQDRIVIRDYYAHQMQGGRCPPGLAKKHNGCVPPGHAKRWIVGRPLPRDVVFYDLPYDLLVRLPPPPPGYRYVSVAGDVLLIAIGTAIVVDAIEDILW